MSPKVRLEIAGDLKAVAGTAARVQEFGEQHGIASALIRKVSLCLEELLTNAIRHGAAEKTSEPPISVDLELVPDGLLVEMRDAGRAFDPFADAPAPDLDSDLDERPIGGLGVHLVKVLADHYEYRRESERNRVTLTFSPDPSQSSSR